MKKTTKDKKSAKKEEKPFDWSYLLPKLNPFLKNGFLNYIADKQIKSEREFLNLYKKYGELR